MEPPAKLRSKPKGWAVRGTKHIVHFSSSYFFFLLIPVGNRNRSSERPFECFWPSKEQKAACKHLVNHLSGFQSNKDPLSPIKLRWAKSTSDLGSDQDFLFGFVVNGSLSTGLQRISEAIFFVRPPAATAIQLLTDPWTGIYPDSTTRFVRGESNAQ